MSTSVNQIPELKRIQFFAGQRLTAQDLTDLQDANRELRWLHNRSLHGWGIGIGYAATGERGDTSVTIGPGYAIDCLGRELILTTTVNMTVPATAGNTDGTAAVFFLTISYKDDSDQSALEQRSGVCLPGGTVRLTESPFIQWQQATQVRTGLDIILAQANVLNCQLNTDLVLTVRRSAQPTQQPYIYADQISASDLLWAPLTEVAQTVGITTSIDTSSGNFQAVPAYFVQLVGSRQLSNSTGVQWIITLPSIKDTTPQGFSLEVYIADASSGQLSTDPTTLPTTLQWTVVWMGVEG